MMKGPLALMMSYLLIISAAADKVRLCVPTDKFDECQQMVKDTQALDHNFMCVQGADRQDCIDKIAGPFMILQLSPMADAMYAEPEDLLLAYKRSNATFNAFKAVRTKEEPESEFRYEAVAVVPANSPVKKLSDLKGLKSCHTGVGRNAGYKIPFTMLTKMGVMHAEDDSTLSARESELKAFSDFFSKSCIVGTWSTHADYNQILKKKYSNLCSMCEKPDQCDYPDNRSGYDGALRCLADGGGDVAFTKVIVVKKFFGLPHGRIEAQESTYDHTKFKYLCPDGSMKPLDGDACIWAARPWPVFIAHNKFTSGDLLAKMKDDLQKIAEFGENKQAMWRKDVLGMEDQHLLKDIEPITPLKYLQHAGYYDVLTQRQEFGPYKAVRICEVTLGFLAGGKCEKLSTSAFSRGVRPKIECVEEDNVDKCMNAVKTNRADLTFVDPHDAYFAIKKYNLKPLMMEKYGNDSHQYLGLIVPKSSTIKSLKDINKDTKVCWSSKKAEYDVALEAFADAGMIERKCPFKFSSYGSQGMQNCLNEPSTTVNGKPNYDDLMFKPLTPSLGKDYEMYHPEEKFELVCPPSPLRMSRMPLTDIDKCNYGFIPPRMMMVKESINQLQKDELIAMFIKIGQIYDKNPDYFRLFGNFQNKPDVMVSNTATGFEPVKNSVPHWDEYTKTMDFMTAPC